MILSGQRKLDVLEQSSRCTEADNPARKYATASRPSTSSARQIGNSFKTRPEASSIPS